MGCWFSDCFSHALSGYCIRACLREVQQVKKGASKTNAAGSKFRPTKEAQGISLEQIQLTGSAKQNLG